jgi:hypothetical protein
VLVRGVVDLIPAGAFITADVVLTGDDKATQLVEINVLSKIKDMRKNINLPFS